MTPEKELFSHLKEILETVLPDDEKIICIRGAIIQYEEKIRKGKK